MAIWVIGTVPCPWKIRTIAFATASLTFGVHLAVANRRFFRDELYSRRRETLQGPSAMGETPLALPFCIVRTSTGVCIPLESALKSSTAASLITYA